jgi:hypothetical protein
MVFPSPRIVLEEEETVVERMKEGEGKRKRKRKRRGRKEDEGRREELITPRRLSAPYMDGWSISVIGSQLRLCEVERSIQ